MCDKMNEAKELTPSTKRFFDLVYSNQIKALRTILKRDKVNPNIPDTRTSSHRTALLYACQNRLLELAEVLLETKPIPADVNCEDLDGRRPVWWAAQYGHVELAELLVKKFKCEVDFVDTKTGCTPLYRAIVTGTAEVCAILVHGGANVNLRRLGYGVGAESPLMKAVQMDNLPICQVLVNSLCDLDYRTEQGFTALHYSIAYRRYDITEFLLENKINKHAASNNGITPMAIAIEHLNPVMVRMLIKHGYNMNKMYRWKETPLSQAIALHNEKCALVLVHWGCNLTTRANYFLSAASAGLVRLMYLLLLLNPSFLNQGWIREKKWPAALYIQPDVCSYLHKCSKTTLSLKQLSRAAIFKYTKYFPARYQKLPLPQNLLDYISFKDFVPEAIYEEKELKEDCPTDCDFLHPWRDLQCPDIEISDIDGESDYSDMTSDEDL